MAMAASLPTTVSSSRFLFCFFHSSSSSSSPSPPLRLLLFPTTTTTTTTNRLLHISCSSFSSDPIQSPDTDADAEEVSGGDGYDGFEIEVTKVGKQEKKNGRLIRARVRADASLEAVWAALTDYEGLAGFIPSLAECRLLDQRDNYARLYQEEQVGQQDLALGLKFNAKGVIDCYEKEMEVLPNGRRRREIQFQMVDGDFKTFVGKWSVEEVNDSCDKDGEILEDCEFQTTLSYMVELEPKLWVPVRLLEGRICKEIRTNLVCVRDEAQRIHKLRSEVE